MTQTEQVLVAAFVVFWVALWLRVGWMLLKLLQWKYQTTKFERKHPPVHSLRQHERATW